ncbi:DDE-type integrase/transposase/recombinase [Rhizobium mongolense]|uniref:DDE-type integrase/transposase/recombinase n=1 Tax=Rhizobium mongolense TaxID=57676 RepID=UPI0034A40D6D
MTDEKGHYLHPLDDEEFIKFVSHADYYEGIVSGGIRIEDDYFTLKKTQFREVWGDLTIQDLTADSRALVFRKKAFIDRYDRLIESTNVRITAKMLERLLETWNDEIIGEEREKQKAAAAAKKAESSGKKTTEKRSHKRTKMDIFENAPCVDTFYDFYNKYYYFDKNLIALTRKPTKPGCTRNRQHHSPESLALAMAFADRYYGGARTKKNLLYEEYKGALGVLNIGRSDRTKCTKVTYDAFNGMIMAGATYDRVLTRHGAARARKVFRPQWYGFDITRPGELVAFDDHECDLAVWFRFYKVWDSLTPSLKKIAETTRVWISIGVDTATGYIVSIRMSKKRSSRMVIDAIEMALSDKTHLAQMCGARRPWFPFPIDNITSDNGTEYTADEVTEKASACGIEMDRTPAEQPWLRGTCERTLRTLGELVTHGMPGKTFSNVVEKGDAKPEETAALLAEEFYALLVRMVVDYHHLRISGPRRQAPHNAVAKYLHEMKGGSRKFIDLHLRRHIFGVNMNRVIHPEGIIVWGIRYNSDELQMLRTTIGQAKVRIRVHREDIRWISVQMPDRTWITVKNRFGFEGPVGLLEWIKAREDVIADAELAQKDDLEVMWAALARRRETGDSAVLAAGLTMHWPSDDDIRRHHKVMFEGANFEQKRALAPLPTPVLDKDQLLQSGFRAIKITPPATPEAPRTNTRLAAKPKPFKKSVEENDDYDAY